MLTLYMKAGATPAVAELWDRYFFIIGFIYLIFLPAIIKTVVEDWKTANQKEST